MGRHISDTLHSALGNILRTPAVWPLGVSRLQPCDENLPQQKLQTNRHSRIELPRVKLLASQ